MLESGQHAILEALAAAQPHHLVGVSVRRHRRIRDENHPRPLEPRNVAEVTQAAHHGHAVDQCTRAERIVVEEGHGLVGKPGVPDQFPRELLAHVGGTDDERGDARPGLTFGPGLQVEPISEQDDHQQQPIDGQHGAGVRPEADQEQGRGDEHGAEGDRLDHGGELASCPDT